MDRGILFSAPMVRALLAGTKTQTRRALRVQPHRGTDRIVEPFADGARWFAARNPHDADELLMLDKVPLCPYGQPGDRLWVREAWRAMREFDSVKPSDLRAPADGLLGTPIAYEASRHPDTPFGKLRPGMFMPRWASRITLEITGVRVERLQDISAADCISEGIVFDVRYGGYCTEGGAHFHVTDPRISYWSLWDAINGEGSVEANPWVWVVEFIPAR